MNRKHTPFTSLSRRKRWAHTLKIKALINRERETRGGLFHDECDHATVAASRRWVWSDSVFPGDDPAVFWNAEIITAHVAFADAVAEAAFNEALLRLKVAGRQSAEPADYRHSQTIGYTLIDRGTRANIFDI
ncbi:hypothetical protein AAGU66_06550 [Edwardsiella ictaluri]|uniref:hypothetical protein n=1 Tax=Edwardsiella ictaluri TaxID=67780 RepID=UPI000DF9B175|nr:hypothetical protein [Edwardsiella ictaluri]UCQ48964.1 hypothetical protein DB741_06955 [Edwardsiella ictaluri]UCQ52218.1 hypothetical protein DB731_06940 [Edwardsiella ictaluri]WFO10125.1 hypothetical protein MAY76_00925 [Edwardsiella ictaluri]STP80507.1 Uncharacterised protein [Edwardsiella ictaluri]STQ88873.1 Uncharacterised protein [Edwardsiella ictaluri]